MGGEPGKTARSNLFAITMVVGMTPPLINVKNLPNVVGRVVRVGVRSRRRRATAVGADEGGGRCDGGAASWRRGKGRSGRCFGPMEVGLTINGREDIDVQRDRASNGFGKLQTMQRPAGLFGMMTMATMGFAAGRERREDERAFAGRGGGGGRAGEGRGGKLAEPRGSGKRLGEGKLGADSNGVTPLFSRTTTAQRRSTLLWVHVRRCSNAHPPRLSATSHIRAPTPPSPHHQPTKERGQNNTRLV